MIRTLRFALHPLYLHKIRTMLTIFLGFFVIAKRKKDKLVFGDALYNIEE